MQREMHHRYSGRARFLRRGFLSDKCMSGARWREHEIGQQERCTASRCISWKEARRLAGAYATWLHLAYLSLRLRPLFLSLFSLFFSLFIPSSLRPSNSIVECGRRSLRCSFVRRINACYCSVFLREKTAYRSPRNCELSSRVKRWSSAVTPFRVSWILLSNVDLKNC